jgi:hypothetical protein
MVIIPVRIEPYDGLGERLERRQVQKPRTPEPLNAGAARQFPVVGPLIVAADIADGIRIDLRQRRVDADGYVLDAGEQPLVSSLFRA